MRPHRDAEGGAHRGAGSHGATLLQRISPACSCRCACSCDGELPADALAGSRSRTRMSAGACACCASRDVRRSRAGAARAARRGCDGRRTSRSRKADLEEVFRADHERTAKTGRGACMSGFPHAAVQGNAALLEGQLPDGRRAGASRRCCTCSVFGHALIGARAGLSRACAYTQLPGARPGDDGVLQNSFANSSSSLIQSKITGNSCSCCCRRCRTGRFFAAYVLALDGARPGAWARRVRRDRLVRPDCRCRAALDHRVRAAGLRPSSARSGMIAGIWAEKFDQLAAFQNFLDRAAHVPVGRVLFDPLAAAGLAARCRTSIRFST